MTYYANTTKKVRLANAMAAMKLGSPEGVRTVEGYPIAYYVSGGIPGQPSNVTLTTYKWSPTGRCTAKVHHLVPSSYAIQLSGLFKVGKDAFWFNFYTATVAVHGHADFAPSSQHLIESAYRMFEGKSVKLGVNASKGDTVEAARRRYHRVQAEALLKHMPVGAQLLPAQERAAYTLDTGRGTTIVTVYKPTTAASKLEVGDPNALKHQTFQLFGKLTVNDVEYKLSQDSKRLVLCGSQDFIHENGRVVSPERVAFDRARPLDKAVVPDELAWYEVCTCEGRAHVTFSYLLRGVLQTYTTLVQNNQVKFKNKTYAVDSYGNIAKA